jgi:hypothetical protein
VFATLALALAAGLAPTAAPAPLPDRWLLKLVPEKLPPLPDRFYASTWYATTGPFPSFGPSWEFWAEFRKAGQDRPAEAVLTLPGTDQAGFGGVSFGQLPTTRGHRTVPLAVHGPLVEFERRLYTATIRTLKSIPGQHAEREMLHLGSAIELKNRVWYQAGTTTPMNGKGLSVEEWRIEFEDDPRTADRGTATLRGHWRVLTEPEGESFDAEIRFRAGKTHTGGRTVDLLWPRGTLQTRSLPRLKIEDAVDGLNIMMVDGMHQLTLSPATKPRPQLLKEKPGLVQPPTKKPGK